MKRFILGVALTVLTLGFTGTAQAQYKKPAPGGIPSGVGHGGWGHGYPGYGYPGYGQVGILPYPRWHYGYHPWFPGYFPYLPRWQYHPTRGHYPVIPKGYGVNDSPYRQVPAQPPRGK